MHEEAKCQLDIPFWYRCVLAFCHSRLISPIDAEDATQETFVRALMCIDELRSPAAMGGWLRQISHHVCVDMIRRQKVRQTSPADFNRIADDETEPVRVARLVRATGSIQLLSPGARDWTTVSSGSNESFVAGSRVKTNDGVSCELQTSADGLIRLNQSAELILHQANQVELVVGQLWCLAPSTNSIDVEIPVSNVETPQLATLACPSSSEFQCVAGNDFASCNSVSPGNANASMTLGAFSCPVAPGETVSVDSNQKIDRTASSDSVSKVWQLPLLALGTSEDQELRSLLTHLLAPIGMTKARHLNENQIRQLGPSGAIPLLAYVVAESSPEQLELRRTATRLASELADQRGAEMLARLTSDPDAFIANQAKETLRRLLVEPQ